MESLDLNLVQEYLRKLEGLYKTFTLFTKDNPVVGGMIGVWCLGVITTLFRNIPMKIYNNIKNFFIVDVVLSSNKESFFMFLNWFEQQNFKIRYTRSFSVDNGRHGYDSSKETLGFGTHYFVYKYRIFKLTRSMMDNPTGSTFKEIVTIQTLGFTTKKIKELIKDSQTVNREENPIYNYKLSSDGWSIRNPVTKREWDSVILPVDQKTRILGYIETFLNNKDFYKKKGIPYNLGLIFNGVSGSGKTSLIRAIATKLNKNVKYISCSSVTGSTFADALCDVDINDIVVLEDFDSISSLKKRKLYDHVNTDTKKSNESGTPILETKTLDDIFCMSLSDFLNAIDGVFCTEGRIMIATTNTIEYFDDAVIRKGRFDYVEHFDYATLEIAIGMLKHFYEVSEVPEFNIKPNISSAYIQGLCIQYINDIDKVIDKIKQ